MSGAANLWVTVKRAEELFHIDWSSGCSPMVEATWHTHSAPGESFIAVAESHWEIVATRQGGSVLLTMRGPETAATMVPIPREAEFFGIRFKLGTFMPALPPKKLIDRSITLTRATASTFSWGGCTWEVPSPANADLFIEKLVRAGLLVTDPVVTEALNGGVDGLSRRTVERRIARATGLTRGAIAQIRRAETAVGLLSSGMSAVDVAHVAGYADQPHLTRSLKRFIGQTPSQIAASDLGD